LGPPVRFCWCL